MSSSSNSLTTLALQKFKRNFWGVFSFWFIVFVGIISVFSYTIAPDNSQYANQMNLSIHSKKPGFKVKMLTIPNSLNDGSQSWFSKVFFGNKYPDSEVPIQDYKVIEDELLYTEYASDGLTGNEKSVSLENFKQDDVESFIHDRTFTLGTDKYGRDLLSRILTGARISFFIGFVAVLISLIIGIFLGSIAGYFGGKTDAFIMWLINVTWSIPTLLLVIAITLALGKGFCCRYILHFFYTDYLTSYYSGDFNPHS